MNCWLNVHTPLPVGDDRVENDRCAFLQVKGRHYINEVKLGDFAVIYETVTVENDGMITVNGKRQTNRAYTPRGGIVSFIKLEKPFIEEEFEYNGRVYIGYFPGDYILQSSDINKPLVTFQKMDQEWQKTLQKHFHPLINGGFRKLEPDEFEIVCKLLGISSLFV